MKLPLCFFCFLSLKQNLVSYFRLFAGSSPRFALSSYNDIDISTNLILSSLWRHKLNPTSKKVSTWKIKINGLDVVTSQLALFNFFSSSIV